LKYDNNDNFSKESRIGGDIIDSNVTEGLTSLPPVESRPTPYHAKSKVTACNAMHVFCGNRNLKMPVMARTLHLPKPYDSRPTPHPAMQPRIVEFNPPPHRAVQ
jgi:hypothetical protein